jgi:hypothetical protein
LADEKRARVATDFKGKAETLYEAYAF